MGVELPVWEINRTEREPLVFLDSSASPSDLGPGETFLPGFVSGHRELGFPGSSDGKESACSAGDLGSTPGSGRSPWRKEWQPTPVSPLQNSIDRRAWQATVYGVLKRWT